MENQMSENEKNYLISRIENGLIEEQLEFGDVDCHINTIIEFIYDEEDDYFYCVSDDIWIGEEYLCFIGDDLVAYQQKTVLIGYKPSENEKKLYNYKNNYIEEIKWSYIGEKDYEDEIEILGLNGDIDYILIDYIAKDNAFLEDILLDWEEGTKFYEYIKNNLKGFYKTNNI